MASQSPLAAYLQDNAGQTLDPAFVAYLASLEQVAAGAPEIARAIVEELADQRANLKMIASENYCSLATQLTMGNLFTDKYAEGIAGHRFYAGCDRVDAVEERAAELARDLFGAAHAYVQPHSGADANLVAFWAILSARVQAPAIEAAGGKSAMDLSPGQWAELRRALGDQRLLGLDLSSGGHLTHGYRLNASGAMFEAHSYGVDPDSGLLDYDRIRAQALEVKPLILLAGYSAYPRKVNFRVFKEIADEVGAVFMVDMAHFAGLVAGKVFTGDFDPVSHADIVTTTTHKTLRGPRGGMVLCNEELAPHVDKGCPMVLGGPLPHVMAAKAVAFAEANTADFRAYAARIVDNAQALADAMVGRGMKVLTGGTENHLLQIDVRPFGINGRQAEAAMRQAGVTLNRNSIPADPNGPWYTSGLRVGTPALTTLGMGPDQMGEIAAVFEEILSNSRPTTVKKTGKPSRSRFKTDDAVLEAARAKVRSLLEAFPLYPELDLDYLRRAFAA